MTATWAWVAWLIAGMVFLISTRNPIYIIISLVLLLILGAHLSKKKDLKGWVNQNIRFLGTMILLSTLINGLFTHAGQSVIFTLPANWLLIGGNITYESLVYGVVNGLIIGALYLLFNIFNLALSTKQITRLIPPAFHPLTMMITVSLTFFPSIQERAREIKEAQIIRGNPIRKVSDWLPIMIPLLITSLEKAILLSESMTARGFHSQVKGRNPSLGLAGLILAIFSVFSGWVLSLYNYPQLVSIMLYVLGAALLFLVLFLTGRGSRITNLHRESWQVLDVIIIGLFAVGLVTLIGVQIDPRLPSLGYSPYPSLVFPDIEPVGILLSLMPGIPLALKFND